MNKRVLAVLSAGFALVGCTREAPEESYVGTQYDPSKVVCVTTDVATRGTPVTNVSQMTDLGIFCSYTGQTDWSTSAKPNKMYNKRLVRNSVSGVWQFPDGPVQWNAQNASDRYTFFAYAPLATGNYDQSLNLNGNGLVIETADSIPGIPTIVYSVPSLLPFTQPDLMVAVPQYNFRPLGQFVHLPMQHALTCVGFQVSGNGEKITNIRIDNVRMYGRLALDGGNIQWDFTGFEEPTVTNFPSWINFDPGQQYYTATPTMTTNLLAGNGYLMMIPQTLSDKAKIVITYNDGHVREYPLNGEQWLPGKKIDYKIAITPLSSIVFSPTSATIPQTGIAAANNPITVTCASSDQRWILTAVDPLMHMSFNADGSNSSNVLQGQGTKTIYVGFDANPYTTNRVVTITMNGTDVVTFTHLKKVDLGAYPGGGTPPAGAITCVGAFWRTDQKGERIIRIPIGANAVNVGNWSASVAWTDSSWAAGDIVLSTTPSSDPNVNFTTALTPGDAESYPVNSTAQLVSGTVAANGTIYFRVGLKSTYTPTESKPVRYAALLLRYGTPVKEQLIFLRQGQDPDYVMRPMETATGSTMASRPLAAKFSPYNLTATNMTAGGPLIANHAVVNPLLNPGTFTQYPSQTGAFFQWASVANILVAYHPVNPLSEIIGWSITAPLDYWESGIAPNRLLDLQDGSPKAYTLSTGSVASFRRPRDGADNVAVPSPSISGSEMRQSLWLAPQSGTTTNSANAMSGYYADGFYDRRMRNTTAYGDNGAANAAVAWTTKDVAYTGILYFNSATGAGLFFPASGYRTANEGSLSFAGKFGYYWSSTSTSTANSCCLIFIDLNNYCGTANRGAGYNIRCVRNN